MLRTLMQYHFFANDEFNAKAVYVHGKMLVTADTLSRHPSAVLHLETLELS